MRGYGTIGDLEIQILPFDGEYLKDAIEYTVLYTRNKVETAGKWSGLRAW